MFSDSVIDPATVQAYLETEYRVCGTVPFILRIGQVSPDLLAAHKRHGVSCSAFLTAWNPFSQVVDEPTNQARQRALAQKLSSLGLPFVEGVGQHPSNHWPGEDGFLVFGLALEAAKALGVRFEQNAVVWSDANATPRLVLLR